MFGVVWFFGLFGWFFFVVFFLIIILVLSHSVCSSVWLVPMTQFLLKAVRTADAHRLA